MWAFTAVLCILNFIHVIGGETAVLILARGGSKGIPLKNLQTIGGLTILERAIKTARKAGCYDVTVSTDHPLIALEALRNGAHIFHRSRVTATDWAPSIWGAAEFLSKRYEISTLILIQATSPFILPARLLSGLRKLHFPIARDCVFSTTRSFQLRWKETRGNLYPINFQLNARPRRQDWHGELVETGGFYITRRHLVEKGYFQNNKSPVIFEDLHIIHK